VAQARRRRAGETERAQLRRIGQRHAVVVPARSVQVLDMGEVDRAIVRATKQLAAMAEQRIKLEETLSDLRAQRDAFDALAIERDDDDPEVPQPRRPQPDDDGDGDADSS